MNATTQAILSVLATYLGADEGTDTTASTTEDDTIVEQAKYQYDVYGNVILATSYQRHENIAAVDELTPTNARVSYSAAVLVERMLIAGMRDERSQRER